MRPLRVLLLLVALLASSPIRAEILIVTSSRSGPIELTRDQAEKLYLGRSSTFSDGTPASLVDLPNGQVRDEFYLKLTGKNPAQIQAYWSRLVFTGRALPPKEARSLAEARQWLTDTPNLIGYLDRNEPTTGMRILLRLP
ncbi:hypothetical protein [Zoogloea sp.]|uniref:hypothetical protein n=1 Tax=Zoogloea sp. TaxID=49181 RepID=UPI001AC09567|nr:hypothetical protein [Zoogloea sp.]MBN8283221.1 hypothetical protein [Zoogloea sp.]